MKKSTSFFMLVWVWVLVLPAQSGENKNFRTSPEIQFSQLVIKVDDGNISLKSSQKDGIGYYKTNNSIIKVSESYQAITQNTEKKSISFDNSNDGMTRKNVLSVSPSGVLPDNNSTNLIQFAYDPNVSTDFCLDIIKGTARLDFTGLKISNVTIKGGSSDIFIDFNQVNKTKLKQINVHDAVGKIVIRNPENANAELISIKNDMGDISFVVGSGNPASGVCNIHSAIGSCVLVVDKSQPVKITVKKSMITSITVASGFQKQGENIYVNSAYQKAGKGMQINCDKDAGSIEVIEN